MVKILVSTVQSKNENEFECDNKFSKDGHNTSKQGVRKQNIQTMHPVDKELQA